MKPSGSKREPQPSIDRDLVEFWRERYVQAYSQMTELREEVARLHLQLGKVIEHQRRVDKHVARLELKARKRRPERPERSGADRRSTLETSGS